jgi:hypothetical protein
MIMIMVIMVIIMVMIMMVMIMLFPYLINHCAMETYERSGQLHGPAALTLEHIGWEAG